MNDRCGWCGTDPLYVDYHDTEWGVPETGSRALFEKLILDGFQAGLSWLTILRIRVAFRAAFAGFDPAVIAEWGPSQVDVLLQDSGIVRHRGKIEAAIRGARAWQVIEARQGFSRFLWTYVDGSPLQPHRATAQDVPGLTPLSQRIAKDLATAGFGFCGPTIVYAFMQAVGMVNDHVVTCRCHAPLVERARSRASLPGIGAGGEP